MLLFNALAFENSFTAIRLRRWSSEKIRNQLAHPHNYDYNINCPTWNRASHGIALIGRQVMDFLQKFTTSYNKLHGLQY